MIGKKIILIPFLVVSGLAHGFTVTDPVSYMYYVQQIKKATDQISQAQQQVQTLGGIKTEVDNLNQQVKGVYYRAMGAVGQINDLKKQIEKTPSTVQGQASKWKGLFEEVDGYIDASTVLDKDFGDPRIKKGEGLKGASVQYDYRQNQLKKSISNAERVLQVLPQRMEIVEGLASKIDTTKNIKDAQDLNNRIMIEILKVNYEMLTMFAHMAEADALLNYSGVTKEGSEIRAEIAASKKQTQDVFKAHMLEVGVDIENATDDDIRTLIRTL